MSKNKTAASQARQAEKVRISELVPCECCEELTEPTGIIKDRYGFNQPVGLCVLCEAQ